MYMFIFCKIGFVKAFYFSLMLTSTFCQIFFYFQAICCSYFQNGPFFIMFFIDFRFVISYNLIIHLVLLIYFLFAERFRRSSMQQSITPSLIKRTNRTLIYQYIYTNRSASQRDLIYNLHLSRPTVSSNLESLEKSGMIKKGGTINNDFAGRKPTVYKIVEDYRIGIGVNITRYFIELVSVDLYGKITKVTVHYLNYQNSDDYFEHCCVLILNFIASLHMTDEHILGIGIVLPALISPDRTVCTYGKILDCTGLTIDRFQKHLRFPCSFLHDSNAAAYTELWNEPGIQNAFYLLIGDHMGGAMIRNHNIIYGKHGHSSTIEHLTAEKNGKPCYCGNRGCEETVCSVNALLADSGESLSQFFTNLRSNKEWESTRWSEYLRHLSDLLGTLHLIYDTDFIFGGDLATYLTEEDLNRLYDLMDEEAVFKEPRDFLRICTVPEHSTAIGGGLLFIKDYLDSKEITY